MIYVTEDMVLEIYTKQDDATLLMPFILTAEQLTNRIEDYVINTQGKTLNIPNLTEVQRWLSAHFTTAQEKVTKNEKVSSVGEGYDLSTKVGLANSHYGQTAMLLDESGYLRKLDEDEIPLPQIFWSV